MPLKSDKTCVVVTEQSNVSALFIRSHLTELPPVVSALSMTLSVHQMPLGWISFLKQLPQMFPGVRVWSAFHPWERL